MKTGTNKCCLLDPYLAPSLPAVYRDSVVGSDKGSSDLQARRHRNVSNTATPAHPCLQIDMEAHQETAQLKRGSLDCMK